VGEVEVINQMINVDYSKAERMLTISQSGSVKGNEPKPNISAAFPMIIHRARIRQNMFKPLKTKFKFKA
jgi:hypothetical protein